MNINDETLSAFLDGELSEQEMESVREALADDETVSNRLASLADVDRRVAEHYSRIDDQPMPAAVTALLAAHQTSAKQGNVVHLSTWRRAHQAVQHTLRQHAAIAAAFALVIGFGVAHIFPINSFPTNNSNNDWQAVSQSLDRTASGTVATLSNGRQLKPRLTFVNQQGQYCRQFQLSDSEGVSENIACRITAADNSAWDLAATVRLEILPDPASYQTASGGSLLDSALDQMIRGEVFGSVQEQQLIQRQWTID
jgi:hypothetical protein